MIFVHEIHRVTGTRAHDFEATYRRHWMPALARGDDARVAWYAGHAHLTCFAYQVLTLTAFRNGAAWLRTAERIHAGDLLEPTRALDQLRHDVEAKLLLPGPGSTLGDIDLATVPVDADDRGPALFVESTYRAPHATAHLPGDAISEPVAVFRSAHPRQSGDELVSWCRVTDADGLLEGIATGSGAPASSDDGLELCDSRLWRLAPFSPLG